MAGELFVAHCEWALVGGPILETEPVLIRRRADVAALVDEVRARNADVAVSIDPDDLWRALEDNPPRHERERVSFGRGDDRRWWRVTWEVWPSG